MIKNIKIEVCYGSVDDCLIAQKQHADRIELNSALELGGLTPSLAEFQLAKKKVSLPIVCMIRPRTSGFYYTENQFETMLLDAKIFLENGTDGIVFGFLNQNNTIDINRTKKMVDLAHQYQKEAIFHKAFDQCIDLDQALEDCIACGIDRILTSGGAVYPHILDGAKNIQKWNLEKQNQIELLPGGGVRKENIKELLEISKAVQIHMTAKQIFDDHGNYTAVDESTLKEILKNI